MFESLKHPKVGSELIPELLRSLPEDFRLDDHQVEQFGTYLDLILQWNQKAGSYLRQMRIPDQAPHRRSLGALA
jgi:hypothetical protein